MMRPFSLSILLFGALAGCFGQHPTTTATEPPIHWGLGLTIPHPLPAPGPFREGQDNTTAFAVTLNRTITQVLKDCKAPAGILPQAREQIRLELFFIAILTAIDGCGNTDEQARQLREETKRDGTANETYARLRAQAVQAVADENALLSHLRPPGSIPDADVQGTLMGYVASLAAFIDTGDKSMADYNRTNRDVSLDTAYLNILSPINAKDAYAFMVERYPWSDGVCTHPDLDVLKARISSEIAWILNASRVLEPPREGEPFSQIYGYTLKGTLPAFQYFAAQGWWQPMLGQLTTLSWDRGHLETHQDNRLPTREEADYLYALYQSTNRTWGIETRMDYFKWQLSNWSEPEFEARAALGLSKMHDGRLDNLSCKPTLH
jgi:hypothetical protein